MHFDEWLRAVRAQERAKGVSHRKLASDPLALTRYAVARLDEATHGIVCLEDRIPAATLEAETGQVQWEVFRDDFVERLLGIMESVGTLLTVASCSSEELEARYAMTDDQDPSGEEPSEEPESVGETEESDSGSEDETVGMPVVATLADRETPVREGIPAGK